MKMCRLLTSSKGQPDFQESSLCLLTEAKPKKQGESMAILLVYELKVRELSERHDFTTYPSFTSAFVAQNRF